MNSTRERRDVRNDYDSKSRAGYSYARENRNPRENDKRNRGNLATRPNFYDYDAVQSNQNYRDGYQGNYSARGYSDNYREDYRREENNNYGYSSVAPRNYATPKDTYVDVLRRSDNNYNIAQKYNVTNEDSSTKTKKVKLAGKVKALIIVYITLVILISTMLLINAIPSANAQTDSENFSPEIIIDKDALYKSADGDFTIVDETKNEKYNTTTNWFDKLCDWMENIAK